MSLDHHEALNRVFGFAFIGADEIKRAFAPYLEENLPSVDQLSGPKFDSLVEKAHDELREAHDMINMGLEYGEKNLFDNLLPWTIDTILRSGIVGSKMYEEHFREYLAVGGETGDVLAHALVKDVRGVPVAFTPAKVFYWPSKQLPVWDKSMKLNLGENMSYKEVAHVVLLRQKTPKEMRTRIAKEVLEQGIKSYIGKTGRGDYNAVRREFLEALRKYFPSLHEEAGYRYTHLYTIFERMAMGHIDLHHYLPSGKLSPIVADLEEKVKKKVVPPIALRARVKDHEGLFKKMVECYFNLDMDREDGSLDKGKEERKLKDAFGLRVVVPELLYIGKLITAMRAYQPAGVSLYFDLGAEQRVKDYIRKPKQGRGYQSLHIPFYFNNLLHELQTRTWSMDNSAENNPRQAHEGGYKAARENFMFQRTTLRQRQYLAAVFGFDSVPNSKYLIERPTHAPR